MQHSSVIKKTLIHRPVRIKKSTQSVYLENVQDFGYEEESSL